ncbi:hypothetical protein CRM22_009253 [Opisthorchis felineus]|uniref:Uncharacterized protein n=1 Tax=Opisthorchis felineus TaxID=147828 RepID=A0A4S2LES1_OPIFE|nr:hypothetical protein CRM22_009253 [Opisthorchis felineus]
MAERLVDTFKRVLLKVEGKGTTASPLQFLLMYRLTPNPSTPERKSPAQTLLYRTPRSTFDLLKSPKEEVASSNQKMESYYNRKHGAKWRHFDIGQRVKDHHGNLVSRRQCNITRRIGNDVEMGSKMWIHHANQLKEAYSQPTLQTKGGQTRLGQQAILDYSFRCLDS